ncbi:MAG: hypothetical protein P4M14_01695 [Gammaproteobacteria bacterium]|nr:hypothetical protein [Gammaproteobacteria bacterium]
MNKIMTGLFFLLLSAKIAAAPEAEHASMVALPGGGEIAPAGTLSIPLSPLMKEVHYNVTCQITNAQSEPVDMRFELKQVYLYGQVTLNTANLDNLQGTLQTGENTLIANEVSINGSIAATLVFRNLDYAHPVEVGHCSARPAINTKMATHGGTFVATNQTDKTIQIEVGDFFPTTYTLDPFSNRWVYVSTNNQSITISRVE